MARFGLGYLVAVLALAIASALALAEDLTIIAWNVESGGAQPGPIA